MEVFSYNLVDPQAVPLEELAFPGLESLHLGEKFRSWRSSTMSAVEHFVERWTLFAGQALFSRRLKSSYETFWVYVVVDDVGAVAGRIKNIYLNLAAIKKAREDCSFIASSSLKSAEIINQSSTRKLPHVGHFTNSVPINENVNWDLHI